MLRVIELAGGLASQFATMSLAELGADVIKVEPPGGDPLRARREVAPDDLSFEYLNRRKRSISIDLESGDDSPEASARHDDIAATLDEACSGLSDIERVCFMLKHMEEWRLKEIAESLDTGVGTVKQAVFRAVKKLRVRLDGRQRDIS